MLSLSRKLIQTEKNEIVLLLLCLLFFSVTTSKPKKPDASGKDSDSRASTPSKEVQPVEKSSTNLNTSSTSRSRAPKPASATSTASTPTQEQSSTRELKRGASERDSRDEGLKYVLLTPTKFNLNWNFNFSLNFKRMKNKIFVFY